MFVGCTLDFGPSSACSLDYHFVSLKIRTAWRAGFAMFVGFCEKLMAFVDSKRVIQRTFPNHSPLMACTLVPPRTRPCGPNNNETNNLPSSPLTSRYSPLIIVSLPAFNDGQFVFLLKCRSQFVFQLCFEGNR